MFKMRTPSLYSKNQLIGNSRDSFRPSEIKILDKYSCHSLRMAVKAFA